VGSSGLIGKAEIPTATTPLKTSSSDSAHAIAGRPDVRRRGSERKEIQRVEGDGVVVAITYMSLR
jgi:hypothetical protein